MAPKFLTKLILKSKVSKWKMEIFKKKQLTFTGIALSKRNIEGILLNTGFWPTLRNNAMKLTKIMSLIVTFPKKKKIVSKSVLLLYPVCFFKHTS